MLSQIENIVIVLIVALGILLLSAFVLIVYVCTKLLSMVQHTLSRVESSQTTQEQYMYMMRGDVSKVNTDLTHFFRVNGFENMLSLERREELARSRARGPPESIES